MLHCVYHPTRPLKVVEDKEKEELISTGVWFDHPLKAKKYRDECIKKIKKEDKKYDEIQKKYEKDEKPKKRGRPKKIRNA